MVKIYKILSHIFNFKLKLEFWTMAVDFLQKLNHRPLGTPRFNEKMNYSFSHGNYVYYFQVKERIPLLIIQKVI